MSSSSEFLSCIFSSSRKELKAFPIGVLIITLDHLLTFAPSSSENKHFESYIGQNN